MIEATGVLVLDKPAGMTSHDVVHRVRKVLHTKKVGHAGTLDPDATGVLVVCTGEATRVLEYATATDKTYEVQVVFGTATDTDDASGKVIAEGDAAQLSHADLTSLLPQFTGLIEQQVPAYSAVHIDGRRAYDLAREGKTFELPVRSVQVHALELVSFTPGSVAMAQLTVTCSKGTYIRSLCRDMGRQLGVPAHMSALRRTQSGIFHISQALNLETWESSENPAAALLPMLTAVTLPKIFVEEQVADRLAQGQRVWFPSQHVRNPSRSAHPMGNHSISSTENSSGAGSIGIDLDVRASTEDLTIAQGTVLAAVLNNSLAAVVSLKDVKGKDWLLQPKKVFWKRDRSYGNY